MLHVPSFPSSGPDSVLHGKLAIGSKAVYTSALRDLSPGDKQMYITTTQQAA